MSAKKLTDNDDMVPVEKYRALIKENRKLFDLLLNATKINEQLSGMIRDINCREERLLNEDEKIIELWPSLPQILIK